MANKAGCINHDSPMPNNDTQASTTRAAVGLKTLRMKEDEERNAVNELGLSVNEACG